MSNRTSNFSLKEEAILVSLVKKYKEILECKLSNTNANRKKATCWVNIEKDFNGLSETFRTGKVLRKKYDNMKKRSKKKFADEKSYRRGTGGGPELNVGITPIDEEIKELLGIRVEGKSSEFDEDASLQDMEENLSLNQAGMEKQQTFSESEMITITIGASEGKAGVETVSSDAAFPVSHEESIEGNNLQADEFNAIILDAEPSTSVGKSSKTNRVLDKDWSHYSPGMLRQKKSLALTTNKSGRQSKHFGNAEITTKVSQWAKAKTAIEESKKKFMQEELELKLQHLKEKHKRELELMDYEMQCRKEEHELKLNLMVKEHEQKMKMLYNRKI